MRSMVRQANQILENWFTEPERNAAGRLSIFRIVYGLYYLLCLPVLTAYHESYRLLPAQAWQPIPAIAWTNPPMPPPVLWQVVPLILAFSLILLIVGLWTRPAAALVLLSSLFLLGAKFGFTKLGHGQTFSVVYIPFIMLFSQWDSCYSIDAILRQRRGKPTVSPAESSWAYFWPVRTLLLLLSLLFFGAGFIKLVAGHWVGEPDLMSRILLSQNLVVSVDPEETSRTPGNLNIMLAGIPALTLVLQWTGMLTELLFPLSVINRRFRSVFVAAGVLLHAFNRIVLHINMYMLLLPYMMFVDWEALFGRWLTRLYDFLRRIPSPVLIGGSITIAALATVTAAQVDFGQVSGLPTYALVIAVPFALYAVIRAGINILRHDIMGTLSRRGERNRVLSSS